MRTKDLERTRRLVDLSLDAELDADIKRVMACTDALVELALQADWLAVLEGIDARRRLLQTIVDGQPDVLKPQLSAVCESVSESERALMRVVAHAIATSRTSGGLFAVYN
jgi:hypothetical protein